MFCEIVYEIFIPIYRDGIFEIQVLRRGQCCI